MYLLTHFTDRRMSPAGEVRGLISPASTPTASTSIATCSADEDVTEKAVSTESYINRISELGSTYFI